jgi:exopolysaccharide biosynthesis protein
MKKHFLILFVLCFSKALTAQSGKIVSLLEINLPDSLSFIQIKTDTLFKSQQIISLLMVSQDSTDRYEIRLAYLDKDLKQTSWFGWHHQAEAALNAGYFDRDAGGSVSYLEIADSVISRNARHGEKWTINDSLLNGAVLIGSSNLISIQPANTEKYYETSTREKAVLIAGPLLLLDSEKVKLPDLERFVQKRHPRSCLCTDKDQVVFIAIDGRSEEAEGMSLSETQDFLLSLGCVNAINLDGGGSTTLWTRDTGVVNFPSDKEGERPVSNVLLIIKTNQN